MICPRCGAKGELAIYENYTERWTVVVESINPCGWPNPGTNDSLCESQPDSYNCATCHNFWQSWDDLMAEMGAYA